MTVNRCTQCQMRFQSDKTEEICFGCKEKQYYCPSCNTAFINDHYLTGHFCRNDSKCKEEMIVTVEKCPCGSEWNTKYFKVCPNCFPYGVKPFPSGSIRENKTGKGRFDLIPAHSLKKLAIHFEQGAIKHGENNWRKGMPVNSYIDSALRHLTEYLAGDRSTDHLISATWNCICAAETRDVIDPVLNKETKKD